MLIIGIKFFAALQFESTHEPEMQDKFTICCVPCYNEGVDTLKTCIHSIGNSFYAEKKLLLWVIVDGVVKGAGILKCLLQGNDKPTSELVLDILGADPSSSPPARMYQSLGEGTLGLNFSQVYSGFLAVEDGSIPYICIVKIGDQRENQKPGNRFFR